MNHFIIGTAGHIDHGKTALIKALTSIDCDTHPEEKKRGITINPGYAYIKRDDGEYMAFVDVPGHHRFIGNMIAGASGIDFIMLVVAADDGVMPQTKEHLKICSLLGIQNGIIVINKCDAVSDDEVEMCREEVEDYVKGTFLENKPIFEVSALSGKGIDELRHFLLSDNYIIERRRTSRDFFRLSIDRAFNVTGFGAVVTGTVSSGEVKVGDNITLMPKNISVKVRGIQRHGESVTISDTGTRVALDLTGVKKEDIEVGDTLWSLTPPPTKQIDVTLSFLNESQDKRFDALLLIGTAKYSVKIKILENITPLYATAQIDLPCECRLTVGDIFIIRNTSSDTTIGGGYIIDPQPLNHRKAPQSLLSSLQKIAGNITEYIAYKTQESISPITVEYFSELLQLDKNKIKETIAQSELVDIFDNDFILYRDKCKSFEDILFSGFQKFAKVNPLSVIGVSRRKIIEFLDGFSIYRDPKTNDMAITLLLDKFESQGKINRNGNNYRLPNMRMELTQSEKSNISKIESIINNFGYGTFSLDEVMKEGTSKGLTEKECKNVITYFVDLKHVVKIENEYISKERLDKARNTLIEYLKTNIKEGAKVADLRDMLSSNRKTAITLMEQFDKEKSVIRQGDIRFLP